MRGSYLNRKVNGWFILGAGRNLIFSNETERNRQYDTISYFGKQNIGHRWFKEKTEQ